MKKFLISALARSVLIAGAALSGGAAAQTSGVGLGTPIGEPGVLISPRASQPESMASTSSGVDANMEHGIGPGTRAGVGPPTGGLDSNPYAEAPPRVRAALGGRVVNRSARTSGSGTPN
jgi:hypothetical protein